MDDGTGSYFLHLSEKKGNAGVPLCFRETGEIVSSFVRAEDFLFRVEDTLLGILEAEIVVPLTKEDSVEVVIVQCKLYEDEKKEEKQHDDNANDSKRESSER